MSGNRSGGGRRFVVGYDGSGHATAALRWALAHADAEGAAVAAIEVVAPETAFVPAAPMSPQPHGGQPPRRPLPEPAELLGDHARVPLSVERVEGRTGRALAEAARDADLVVIGAHHSPAHITSGVGAFAADCLRHAGCPVVIVPAE
ncbi:universal stress protein [Actinokineospora auranticolor]|uniref:Nucleotide-binding universal stress UspA family protein n=1 Tax=Actinokineospora auranticolor TaxID=155976 RepID=A0A2S6GIW6_9PSEU|nr:universal stress protein [Actinokineospora auranticolor]PPK65159.1 nucleotide-binding universal stress UspA family protein [Actinokineospora auranticolor]